jgi:hypothetical protein
MAKKSRIIATCTTTGSIRIETMLGLISVQRDERYDISLSIIHDRPYASALNKAAVTLCADESVDWWLHIDNDQSWVGNPLDAIDDGKDLVGFPAPIHRPAGGAVAMCFSAWHLVDDHRGFRVRQAEADGTLKQVDIIGSGSFLLRLESLREASIPAPFERTFDINGVAVHGCDVEFCRKWRESGREMWADFRCVCHHYNTVNLLQVMQDIGEYNDPAEL